MASLPFSSGEHMKEPNDLKYLGPALGALRIRSQITKSKVAKAAGVSIQQITALERGQETPDLEWLAKYLPVLGADFHQLQEALDWVRTGRRSTLFDAVDGSHFINAFRYLLRPVVEEILEEVLRNRSMDEG